MAGNLCLPAKLTGSQAGQLALLLCFGLTGREPIEAQLH